MKNSANIAVRTMQPLPAAAVGRFRERPVSPGLRASFSALWIHQMPLDPAPPIVVVPDATIDLQWIDGILRVAGPDKEANTELVPAGATVIGFRFRPAAAASWLRIRANELVGERPPLENLWGSKASRLANQIWKSQKDGNAVAAIEAVLAEYAADGPLDAAMSAAYALIDAARRWMCRSFRGWCVRSP